MIATIPAPPSGWPSLSPAARYGLPGDFLKAVEPHSEADPAALLMQFMVAVGSMIGRGPYIRTEQDHQHLNLFAVLVGQSSMGRKGTSYGHVRHVVRAVDSAWAENCIQSGLSSGEGLIWSVRDSIEEQKAIYDGNELSGYDFVEKEPGIHDKRLLVYEGEFARPLRAQARDTNTLSAVIRTSWDSGDLRVMTKNSPAKATGAHISIVGHITEADLRRYFNSTDAANGFGNRILWVCVRRSKLLPEGGSVCVEEIERLVGRLRSVTNFARGVGEMHKGGHATALWKDVYPSLSADRFGLFGSVTSRAAPQTLPTRVPVCAAGWLGPNL